MTSQRWHDPWFVARADLPPEAERHEFGAIPSGVLVTDTDPGSSQAQWSADRDVALLLAGTHGPDQLAAVLPGFLEHASALADRPAVASVSLPSRDVDSCRVARQFGLLPTAILAVADLRSAEVDDAPAAETVTVRRAEAGDADAVARLWCEQADYEARVGTLRISSAIRAAITAEVPGQLAGAGTALLAERGGAPVGVVVAESVDESQWCGTRLALAPVSYLSMASTASGARGGGVGSILVRALHRRHREAGVAASALHYSAYNPLSVPFWSRHGYRPLVTSLARPLRDH